MTGVFLRGEKGITENITSNGSGKQAVKIKQSEMVQSTDQPYKPMNGIHDIHPMSASRYRRRSQQDDDDESNDEKNNAGVLKTQPPGKPAFLTARIQSIKTTYDENPILSITKPTSAPNNTPVPSPLGSPYLRTSSGIADVAINSATSSSSGHAAADVINTLSSSLPQLQQPPPPHPSACPREVLSGKDNGGKQPPRLTRVKSEGYDHVPFIEEDDEEVQEKQKQDNSPISIMNRRNIFSTSNSRCCSSSQLVAGPPSTRQESDDAGNQKGKDHDVKTHTIRDVFNGAAIGREQRSRKSSADCGMAPQSFYFDKDRSITDPNVLHEQTDEKINISSWLHSKNGAEMYSLIDGGGNENSRNINNGINRYRDTSSSRNNSRHRDQFSIPDGLISSQPPRSALSIGSTYRGGLNIDSTSDELSDNNNAPHALFAPPPPSSESNDSTTGKYLQRRGLAAHCEDKSFNEDDEAYVPPPPPRYINSKLDDVRTRLLLNPRCISPKLDEDIGTATAAAVLSNMRSSPYRFSERPHQYNSSRPGSASFSAKGYTRPIVRIHHKEHTTTDTDENAILDGDEEEDEGEDEIEEETNEDFNELKSSSATNRGPKSKRKAGGEDVKKEVTWNKNGKRVNRRLSAPESRRKKGRKLKVYGRTNESDIRSNSYSRESSLPAAENDDDGDDNYNLHDLPEEEEDDDDSMTKSGTRGQHRKTTMGSRSRTGCWICRLRKKKCTEERPRCFNCERLNLECFYDVIKPDFVSDPQKKQMKLEEIKTKTKEAKRNAMRKKPSRGNS